MVNAGLVKPLIKELGLNIQTLPNLITLGIEDKTPLIAGEGSLSDYARLLEELYPQSSAGETYRYNEMIWAGNLKSLYAISVAGGPTAIMTGRLAANRCQ